MENCRTRIAAVPHHRVLPSFTLCKSIRRTCCLFAELCQVTSNVWRADRPLQNSESVGAGSACVQDLCWEVAGARGTE